METIWTIRGLTWDLGPVGLPEIFTVAHVALCFTARDPMINGSCPSYAALSPEVFLRNIIMNCTGAQQPFRPQISICDRLLSQEKTHMSYHQ